MQQYHLAAFPPENDSCVADISINNRVIFVLCIRRLLERTFADRCSICKYIR